MIISGSNTTVSITQGYGALIWADMDEDVIVAVPTYPETILDDHGSYTRTKYVDLTARMIESIADEYAVDNNRIYGTGQSMAAKKNHIYVGLLSNMSPDDLSKETKETLDELRNRGILLAIGSSSKNTKYILERLGLKDYFDAISDGTNITKSKPDPEVFTKAAQMLGVSCEDAIVVEDAMSGIDAAYAGGFKSAGIGESSKHPNVTYPIDRFSDILRIK